MNYWIRASRTGLIGLAAVSLLLSVGATASFGDQSGEQETSEQSARAEAESVGSDGEKKRKTRRRAPAKRVVYKPPSMGKPVHTVGGGSRGSRLDQIPRLYVAVPSDHVGRTASSEPSLFWYIDRVPDDSVRIEFTILDEDSIEPEVEAALAHPTQAGVHRIRLSDYGASLTTGMEYEWSVALIVDPDKRSKDIVATGWIDRVEPSTQLASLQSQGAVSAAAYAAEGLWYDALEALSAQIEMEPDNLELQQQRVDLLRQVGLVEVALSVAR